MSQIYVQFGEFLAEDATRAPTLVPVSNYDWGKRTLSRLQEVTSQSRNGRRPVWVARLVVNCPEHGWQEAAGSPYCCDVQWTQVEDYWDSETDVKTVKDAMTDVMLPGIDIW